MKHFTTLLRSKKAWKTIMLLGGIGVTFSSFAVEQFEGDFIRNVTDIINILNLIVAMLTAPAAVLAGWLLTPDWTFGDFFGLREYLYEIWVLVSNIVYIVFAIILLWMAANGIFHPGDTDYVIKKSLPRFLIAILMVPFTWFIVSFTLTMVNKGIAVVMSIPMGTIVSIAGKDEDSAWNRPIIPTKIEFNFGEGGAAHGDPDNIKCVVTGGRGTGVGTAGDGTIPCITPAEFIGSNPSGPFYMIMVYAYDIFKIQKADILDADQFCRGDVNAETGERSSINYDKCIRGFTGLLARFFFSFVWAFFFSILLIGLAVVLLYRAFMLWIYIMFSPMFALSVFFKKQGEKFTGIEVGFKQFFTLAAVPLMVAAILSFGLLFIGIIRDNPGLGGPDITNQQEDGGANCTRGTWTVKFCFEEDGADEHGAKYDSYIVIGGNGKKDKGLNSKKDGADDYSVTLEFGPVFSDLIRSEAAEIADAGVGSIQDIFSYTILNTIALLIIWMATVAAIKKDKVLSTAFAPFENMGNQLGGIIKKAPGLIPIPGGGTLASIPRAVGSVSGAMDTKFNQGARTIADPITQKMLGTTDNKLSRELRDNMADGVTTNQKITKAIGDFKEDINLRDEGQRKLIADSFIAANRNLTPGQKEKIEKASKSGEAELKNALNSVTGGEAVVRALEDNARAVSENTQAANAGRNITINGNQGKIAPDGSITLDGDDTSRVKMEVNTNGRIAFTGLGSNADNIERITRNDIRDTLNAANIRDIAEARANIRQVSQRYQELDMDSIRDEIDQIESINRTGTDEENEDAMIAEVQQALTDFTSESPS